MSKVIVSDSDCGSKQGAGCRRGDRAVVAQRLVIQDSVFVRLKETILTN